MIRATFGLLFSFIAVAPAFGQGRAMKVDDLFRFQRIADSQISPDGKWIVYAKGTVDLEANRTRTNLYIVSTAPDAKPRQLTSSTKSDRHPRWSPDGKSTLFESTRSGSSQLWVIDMTGGEARQLTNISTGANTGTWSPDGKKIAFVSAVWPEFSEKPFAESDAANKKKMDAIEANPVKAKVFTRLFFRHWDEYVEDKRQHLFVISYDGVKASEPKDVTPGDRDAYPTSSTFSVDDDFVFSPDGQHLVFTATPGEREAWNTNFDICRVPVTGGTTQWECLTLANDAADGSPRYSPDGTKLAYRAQKKTGYEADRWKVMVVDCDRGGKPNGTPRVLAGSWDRSVDSVTWKSDGSGFWLLAEENATTRLFEASLSSLDAEPKRHTDAGSILSLSQSSKGRLAATKATMRSPAEAFVIDAGMKFRNVSNANNAMLAELDLPAPESITVKGEGGTPMQMWILKPPGFDASKKWPVAFLVHGGPQGAWSDSWSNRWNPQAWAAQGYIVALPNPRGSTGFGQKYVDEISGDWGGKCYVDLMNGLAYLEKQPWVDRNRIGTAGASFGGYMMNWFAVNTNKFKCIICHCGVWNFDSMYSTTEELWFDEWEHGGPPWGKNRESYEKHSPHLKAGNLAKHRTPMLIVHNDLDFRVPVSEGIQVFTTLQRLGVPSRFINFPDEGHWVLKPRNSQYWHQEVFDWLTKHVPPGGR